MAREAGIWRDLTAGWLALWALMIAAMAWFVADSAYYVLTREQQPGATFLNRGLWYFAHMTMALPILVIAPFQFLPGLRKDHPQIHRALGRAFLVMSLIAGVMAVWLGATIQYEGSRIPLVIFGLVWIGLSAAAWLCAVKRDFINHRKFVIRSFAIGMAFVWVRLLGQVEEPLLSFMSDDEMRNVTREYLSFLLPLLVVEIWLSWLPAVRAALRK
jgi:hypothetical protein